MCKWEALTPCYCNPTCPQTKANCGAINSRGNRAEVHLVRCLIDRCQSKRYGGAFVILTNLATWGSDDAEFDVLTMQDSVVQNCVGVLGGAGFILGNMTIHNTLMRNNHADDGGGYRLIYGASFLMVNASFEDCTGEGGALKAESGATGQTPKIVAWFVFCIHVRWLARAVRVGGRKPGRAGSGMAVHTALRVCA